MSQTDTVESTEAPEDKAAGTVATGTGVTLSDSTDLIVRTASEIENVQNADQAVSVVKSLLEDVEYNAFRIGGYLKLMQSHGWHGEYPNFRAFVETECGMDYRKSLHLVKIYDGLIESGINWEQVKGIGWSKLKEIVTILNTENVAEWVEKAKNLTVLQLIEEVKAFKKSKNASEGGEPAGDQSTVSTFTVKVFPDQKKTIQEAVDKAKHDGGTEVAGVALENIALAYLGESPSKPQTAAGSGYSLDSDGVISYFKAIVSQHSGDDSEALKIIFAGFEAVFPNVTFEFSLKDDEEAAATGTAG